MSNLEDLLHATPGTPVEKPWGIYSVLRTGPRHKVKELIVMPGQRLSLQRHLHRDEHWIVVQGTGTDDDGSGMSSELSEGSTYFIRAMEWHRISNVGKIPLVIIEVQTGSYLEEDDIERREDDYDRK